MAAYLTAIRRQRRRVGQQIANARGGRTPIGSAPSESRAWCDVTSTDYVPALLEDGRRRAGYGPVHKAFAALSAAAQMKQECDLATLIESFNRSGDSTVVIPGEYAEVVIIKA
jgi:hypothetical protein